MRVCVVRVEFDPAQKLFLRSRPVKLEVRVDESERGMRRRDGIVYLNRPVGSISRIDHHFSWWTQTDHCRETIRARQFGVRHCVLRFNNNSSIEGLNRALKCRFRALILRAQALEIRLMRLRIETG